MEHQPIAVFDSGLGGLTVAAALRRRMPHRPLIYFGDTARVPYGTKSAETVSRFTAEIVAFLSRFDPCCIVAACNTVSAVAVPMMVHTVDVPLVDVVAPGARAAAESADDGDVVAVLATSATVTSNAYRNAILRVNPRLAVIQKACPLFVPLVEEGRGPDDDIVQMAVREYLDPVRRLQPAAVVLGCTHYPVIKPAVQSFLGQHVAVIDATTVTADYVDKLLGGPSPLFGRPRKGRFLGYVSDNPVQFASIATRILGEQITDVVRVCPEEFANAGMAPPKRPVVIPA